MSGVQDCMVQLQVLIAILAAGNIALNTWLAHRRYQADKRERQDRFNQAYQDGIDDRPGPQTKRPGSKPPGR